MANYFDKFDSSEEEEKKGNFFDKFDKKSPSKEVKKERTYGEAVKDIGAGVVSGAGALAQLPSQLYGLATGDFSDTGLMKVGKGIERFGEEMKSPELKRREAERAEKIARATQEEGELGAFKTAFGETIKDPALLTSFIAEQAPQLLVPFGAGKATKAAMIARGASPLAAGAGAVTAAKTAGAVQQGADIGAGAYESIYNELIKQGVPPSEASSRATNLARATAGGAGALSFVAQRLPGGSTIEEAIAGVPGKGGRVLRGVKGGVGESLSEVAEETGGKLLQNVAMKQVNAEQTLTEGLGSTAALAAIGGGTLGSVAGLLTSAQKAEIDKARDKAEETGKAQEVVLQLPYDKNVKTGTYGSATIIVNPDGSTEFPSEKNKFAPSVTEELSTKGLKEKYTPQELDKIFSETREVYASDEDRKRVEEFRLAEARRNSKYMSALDELVSKKAKPSEDEKKAAQSAFNTVMSDSVLASFGIGPTAKLRRSKTLDGLDIRNEEDASKVKATLETYKQNVSPGIQQKIDEYLKRPEFTGEIQPEIPEFPATGDTIAFIPRGAREVQAYPGQVIKQGDKFFVEYDRGEGRKSKKEIDPARILINPNPDEIELLNLNKRLTQLANRKDVFKEFLYRVGISPKIKADLGASDLKISPFIRRNGAEIDDLTSQAIESGLMQSTGDDVRDAQIMMDMVSDALAGNFVLAGQNAETYAEMENIANRMSDIQESIQPMNEEDIATFIAEEKRQREIDKAIEEMYYNPRPLMKSPDFALRQQTAEELQAEEERRASLEKMETERKAKQEAEDKAAREKAEIKQAAEKAAGEFELGKTAEEDLTGQKDLLKEEKEQKSVSKVTEKPSRKREPAIQLYSDIPNQKWLEEKRKYSSEGGTKPSGAPRRFGTETGRFILEGNVVNRKRSVLMPVNVLAKIKGENSEQQNVRQKDLEAIKKIMSETGRLPQGERGDRVPFIVVDQNGNAYVNEGNHRIMAAKALGFKYLPVDIVYFNGGEKVQYGDIPPKDVIGYDLEAQDDGFSLDNYSGLEQKSLGSTFETADAKKVADKYNGFVVYNRGDLSLVRAFAVVTGKPVYIPVKGSTNALVDIDSFTGSWISDNEKNELKVVKQRLEQQDEENHKNNPFIKFTNGFAKSAGVPDGLAGTLNGWKNMLGLGNVNVYVTTFDDAKANSDKFTGPHRVIGSSTLSANENGSMRKMADGSYYVAFKKGTSKTQMLEVLAHELGHIHEREAFMNASPATRNAIRQEFNKWLESQKGKTARELVDSLRARQTAKTTKVRAGAMADNLTPYWKSFSEWYADQVSRWATTSEKPVSVVEKFFDKLARTIRNFFNKIKNAGWLPNETFKQYLDDIASKNMIIETKPTDPTISNDPEQMELFSRTKAEELKVSEISDKDYMERIKDQFTQKKIPFKERFEELRPNLYDRVIKGLFDEFRFIKKYSPEAYMKARLSKAIDGALEGLLYYGQVKITDGALDIKPGTKGLIDIYKPLGAEVDQYHIWKALSRDAEIARKWNIYQNMKPADRAKVKKPAQPSFDAELVAGRGKLVEGEINGKPRIDVYRQVLNEEQALNRSVLDVARQQGLIDDEAYEIFSNDIYYIPFYKAMEDTGDIMAISAPGKLTGQYFSKALKGGEKKTNDLMENVLMNWSHILSAAMKNKAGVDTLKAAEAMGAAEKVKSTYEGKDVIKVMENGKQSYYAVSDPDLLDSISLISYMGPKSAFLDVAKGFTNALRYGVTLSPAYKLRNLIRDSISSAAVSPIGGNVLKNVANGLKLSDRGNPTFMAALVGGGVFEMGTAHEGDQAKLIKRLIDKGVKPETILDDPTKIKEFLGKAFEWYNEQGNRFENANRLSLYEKLRKEGKSHLEASYAARDLMDFSLQGSFRAIKVVSQTVPFFNARLQGLYKLGRDGVTPTYRVIYNMTTGKEVDATDKQKAQRFMAVTSSVMLASMLLYMQFKDDEDFKRREDWDRDNFWWFKVNGVIFRVPKPFEIGAAGTLAERTLEQIFDEDVEGKVFAKRLQAMLSDTFSLNPVPQAFKPLIDLYANKDSFTGAPIESAGMERLSKQERYTDNTSALAKALGGISQAGARVLTLSSDAEGLSPVQIDYAIKAYFGWAGSTAASISDKAVAPWSEVEKPGKPVIDTVAMGFIKTVPETQSKFVTQFYESNKMINQAFADMKRYAENGEADKVAKIMEEKGDLIALQRVYDRTSKQLAKYRDYQQKIIRSDMPKEEKELEIQRIKILISEVAQSVESMRVGLKRQ